MTASESVPNIKKPKIFIDVYCLLFAMTGSDSAEYFLVTELLPLQGKKGVTTDLAWKNAYRIAKYGGAINVELHSNEDEIMQHVDIEDNDFQMGREAHSQHLHDASVLGCQTFVSSLPDTYEGLNIPPGLEIVKTDVLVKI